MKRKTLRGLAPAEFAERRVLVRVDYNVPMEADGRVRDATRVDASLDTLRHLVEHGSRPVLLSHLGRPKGEPDPRFSLAPVAEVLAERLETPVRFFGETDTEAAVEASHALERGEVLLLENTRFLPGETRNDPELSSRLARLGDLYVNDAFGSTHRAHASVVGVTGHLRPAVAGFLVERELEALSALRNPRGRPFVVAFGGAKIADKMPLIEALLDMADVVLVGGAMANTFLRAAGHDMGESLVEAEALAAAAGFLGRPDHRLELPNDLVVAEAGSPDASTSRIVQVDAVPEGYAALDIGPATRERFAHAIGESRTFFWNGPMGLFERAGFDSGTVRMAAAAAAATAEGAFTVVGGGDSASAIRQAGLAHAVSHVSTGGGAALEFLASGSLPGLQALDEVER
ncbi:MAG: phosphoglycerate kinase [Gemmatimonadota bacterium]|nr:phosphoglycerate kinase [Gemmatimonadota bacterium]